MSADSSVTSRSSSLQLRLGEYLIRLLCCRTILFWLFSAFRRQQSILMLTDDAEFLHWIQQREFRLSRQRVKQSSLHSQAKVKTKNTVTDKLTSDHFPWVCDWLTAPRCGCEKGPHQSIEHCI